MTKYEAEQYKQQVRAINPELAVIIPRGRENKYQPNECSGKGAALRRLRAFRRKYGSNSEFVTERILNSKD